MQRVLSCILPTLINTLKNKNCHIIKLNGGKPCVIRQVILNTALVSTLPGKNYIMKSKECFIPLHDKDTEKYQSGEWYNKIPRVLNNPWNVDIKWHCCNSALNRLSSKRFESRRALLCGRPLHAHHTKCNICCKQTTVY